MPFIGPRINYIVISGIRWVKYKIENDAAEILFSGRFFIFLNALP